MTAPRDADARWRRAVASLAPDVLLVEAAEITHPDVPDPIRIVNDVAEQVIEGHRYAPLRWRSRLVSDVEGEVPRAEIELDNVGTPLTEWVHAAEGGAGARLRVMGVSLGTPPEVEWELALRVHSVTLDPDRVRARLGYLRVRDLPAVVARHDSTRSPGIV